MGVRVKTKKYRFAFFLLLLAGVVSAAVWYFHGHNIAVLQPRGPVGQKESQLIIIGGLLALIVVIPVFIMAAVIAVKYRESNHRAKYSPEYDHSRVFETLWWGIPIIIIGILSVVAWNSSRALDPYKTLAASQKPITIQVVALNWKWLFIYPQQDIASVNFVQLPVNKPVDFQITSDAVMNSFWIPQLGGQIYAMPGMKTQLHLMADQSGDYNGSSANISGRGFSGMTFTARASTQANFDKWVKMASRSPDQLNQTAYNKLAQPSQNNPVAYYSSVGSGLYDNIVIKYMMPLTNAPGMAGM